MPTERVERRLSAVLAADVTGYSRLMGLDEEGTLALLKAHRHALIDPKIAEHRGRIVKTTGDGILVEFASVVDAVRCAVDVQLGMTERNGEAPPEKQIQFRIGINVGDIIIEGNDIWRRRQYRCADRKHRRSRRHLTFGEHLAAGTGQGGG